jgi:hypothetical protein
VVCCRDPTDGSVALPPLQLHADRGEQFQITAVYLPGLIQGCCLPYHVDHSSITLVMGMNIIGDDNGLLPQLLDTVMFG